MKTRIFALMSSIAVWGVLTIPAGASPSTGPHIISFDAPGADIAANDYNGTIPTSINAEGVITGYYVDATNVYHGFLRSPEGKFTSFDVPGADTTAGSYSGTLPNGINDLGEVAGYYTDASGAAHGFLRNSHGKFTSFDVPGSAGFSDPISLNLDGTIVGYYLDSSYHFHAFMRKRTGVFVSFDGPNACTTGTPTGCYGSAAFSINIFGTIAAGYEDNGGNFVGHALIRSPDGRLTPFQVPESGAGPYQGTGCPGCSPSINASGAIAGTYEDSNNVTHGYLRSAEGRFTTFDVPGAGSGSSQGTGCPSDCAVGLNDFGEITGNYIDGSYTYHGFFRSHDGNVETIDPAGSVATFPDGISELGVVVGYFLDANNVYHGFIRISSRND